MKRIITMIAAALIAMPLVFATNGSAAEEPGVFVAKKKVNMIEYLSGGVGKGERSAMEKVQDEFDLKLVFALDKGDYLANVVVVIKDSSGEDLVHTTANGPWFLADLEPGEYAVSAVYENEKQSRKVAVGETDLDVVRFVWEK
jgi:hypothetical protein